MSVLNVDVSCFQSYEHPEQPKTVNLLKWLQSDKYKTTVQQIRATSDKKERDKLKTRLPAITPSGIFTRRSNEALIRHSGLICLDIDYKGNEHITNFPDLKAELSNIKNVAYCGLSVSGTGYFLLIPISFPELHSAHFAALQEDFARFGITIDRSCKDVARLRGYSFDDTAFYRNNARPYTKFKSLNWTYRPPVQDRPPLKTEESSETPIFQKIERILFKRGIRYGGAGAGHEFRIYFACYCKLFGVPLEECKDLIFTYYPPSDGKDDFSDCYRKHPEKFGVLRK